MFLDALVLVSLGSLTREDKSVHDRVALSRTMYDTITDGYKPTFRHVQHQGVGSKRNFHRVPPNPLVGGVESELSRYLCGFPAFTLSVLSAEVDPTASLLERQSWVWRR